VNDITLLDIWVIYGQGHFTNNSDLFPQKISNRFNGCPIKAVVRQGFSPFTTLYDYTDSNSSDFNSVVGMEFDTLMIVLKQINMTFEYVPTPEGFQLERGLTNNLNKAMFEKEAYIALGSVRTNFLDDSFLDSTSTHTIMSAQWYVPCPNKYQRWTSIFRILSVELWLVLIISIVVAAISTTILARYSLTSEWQVYKTVTISLTNIWAVILGVAVSTMPRAPSLRLLFLAWVCFSIAFSTVFQAFLTTFLVDPGHTNPIENMDELLASGILLLYDSKFNFLFIKDDKIITHIQTQHEDFAVWEFGLSWAIIHKNTSLFLEDMEAEIMFAFSTLNHENSEPVLCKLEDGMIYNDALSMILFHGDPLLRRVSEIIDRVVEAGLYNNWISLYFNQLKILAGKIALVHPLDEYYSFKMDHIQPAFYLLFIGWCLSSLCFIVELLYNRFLSRRK
jgi:hypothetical protein